MKYHFLAVALVATALSGCAQRPEDIQPSYVSPINYQSLSCQQIAAEEARVDQAMTKASKQQTDARTNDTVGVLLIGLPVGSMGGQNIAPQIAQLKGEKDTLDRQAIQANCTGVVAQAPVAQIAKPSSSLPPGKVLVKAN